MKHIVKIMSLVVAISAFWIGLLETSVVPRSYGWLLPVYFIASLGCYGLLMVGVGLMSFPTCPQEAGLLQQGISMMGFIGWWKLPLYLCSICATRTVRGLSWLQGHSRSQRIFETKRG